VRVVAAPSISCVHIYKALTISQMFMHEPNVIFEITVIIFVGCQKYMIDYLRYRYQIRIGVITCTDSKTSTHQWLTIILKDRITWNAD